MIKKDLIIVVLSTFCLTATLFALLPTKSSTANGPQYDPWLDVNDDGVIDIYDITWLCQLYDTYGIPITKAAIMYDSGWIDITDRAGQYFNITHNLNSTDLIVDITGKATAEGGIHQRNHGGTSYVPGWSRAYGGTEGDMANSVIQTSDGGYAIAGETTSYGAGYSDFWLIKTDASGGMQWSRTYGGTADDVATSLIQTSDGGYALAGYTTSFGAGGYDFWLVKTNASGDMQWNRAYGYGEVSLEVAHSLVQTDDGGYAMGGYIQRSGFEDSNFWLVETDASGNMLWNQTYGGIDDEFAYSLIKTSDGGYAIAGWTSSFDAGNWNFWLVKSDSAGNMLWNQTYGGTKDDVAFCVVEDRKGGYVMAGRTNSFGAGHGDFWLVKSDSAGNMLWNQTYGGTGEESAYSLVQTEDGGYAMAGLAGAPPPMEDFWLVKTDVDGNMLWNQTYGGGNLDEPMSLIQTEDGGYAMAGHTTSFGAGNNDFLLVKTESWQFGVVWTDSTANKITLYRGVKDSDWNFVRVRFWKVR